MKRSIALFVAGGLVGGIAGFFAGGFWYEANAVNPEVAAQIAEEQQTQEDFEAFLQQLGSQPASGEGSGSPM